MSRLNAAALRDEMGTSPLQDRFSELLSNLYSDIPANDRHNMETMFFAGASAMDSLVKKISRDVEPEDVEAFETMYRILTLEIRQRGHELVAECIMLAQHYKGDKNDDSF